MKKNTALVSSRNWFKKLLADRFGASGLEYAVATVIILGAVAAGAQVLKGKIAEFFENKGGQIVSAGG
jgi:Flp pilus assembly pilin Flp